MLEGLSPLLKALTLVTCDCGSSTKMPSLSHLLRKLPPLPLGAKLGTDSWSSFLCTWLPEGPCSVSLLTGFILVLGSHFGVWRCCMRNWSEEIFKVQCEETRCSSLTHLVTGLQHILYPMTSLPEHFFVFMRWYVSCSPVTIEGKNNFTHQSIHLVTTSDIKVDLEPIAASTRHKAGAHPGGRFYECCVKIQCFWQCSSSSLLQLTAQLWTCTYAS